jgi:hypothetical protein
MGEHLRCRVHVLPCEVRAHATHGVVWIDTLMRWRGVQGGRDMLASQLVASPALSHTWSRGNCQRERRLDNDCPLQIQLKQNLDDAQCCMWGCVLALVAGVLGPGPCRKYIQLYMHTHICLVLLIVIVPTSHTKQTNHDQCCLTSPLGWLCFSDVATSLQQVPESEVFGSS